jgi:hypothetical protein
MFIYINIHIYYIYIHPSVSHAEATENEYLGDKENTGEKGRGKRCYLPENFLKVNYICICILNRGIIHPHNSKSHKKEEYGEILLL